MNKELSLCREHGLRITTSLRETIRVLSQTSAPMTLAELGAQIDRCDPATIYRILKRLKQIGVVRQLNFTERGARYALATVDENTDYLICEGCGKVEALETSSPFPELKEKLMEKTGFRTLSHELEFYGICALCE
jgi:Fe2+ or Zn2+ uptake regulation protein